MARLLNNLSLLMFGKQVKILKLEKFDFFAAKDQSGFLPMYSSSLLNTNAWLPNTLETQSHRTKAHLRSTMLWARGDRSPGPVHEGKGEERWSIWKERENTRFVLHA